MRKQQVKSTVGSSVKKGTSAYAEAMSKKYSRKVEDTKKQVDFVKGKIAKKEKNNPTRNMTDEQLRQKINRLQMEKQYAQLTTREKSSGEKFVSDILVNSGKQVISGQIVKAMNKGIDEILKKAKDD